MAQNHKFERLIIWIFRLLFLGAVLANIFSAHWLNLFISSLALILSFLPQYLSNNDFVYIPADMQFLIAVFIFATLYLGELREYYLRFWWWDLMLHTISGVVLGMIGFILVFILNNEDRIDVILSPVFIALFSFAFAVTAGVFWEIFEFAMDSFLGLNMQKSGLVDTMWDLIVDCLGGLTASIFGYRYITKSRESYFKKVVSSFLSENSQFFE